MPPGDKYPVFHNYYHFKQQLLESVSIDRKTGMSVVAAFTTYTAVSGMTVCGRQLTNRNSALAWFPVSGNDCFAFVMRPRD